jgi:hypothetical protein
MVRAGVCLDCAIAIHEQVLEQLGKPGLVQAQLCSGSCREAFQYYLTDPKVVGELKPDPLSFECGGKVRQAKPQNCLRGDAAKKRFRH